MADDNNLDENQIDQNELDENSLDETDSDETQDVTDEAQEPDFITTMDFSEELDEEDFDFSSFGLDGDSEPSTDNADEPDIEIDFASFGMDDGSGESPDLGGDISIQSAGEDDAESDELDDSFFNELDDMLSDEELKDMENLLQGAQGLTNEISDDEIDQLLNEDAEDKFDDDDDFIKNFTVFNSEEEEFQEEMEEESDQPSQEVAPVAQPVKEEKPVKEKVSIAQLLSGNNGKLVVLGASLIAIILVLTALLTGQIRRLKQLELKQEQGITTISNNDYSSSSPVSMNQPDYLYVNDSKAFDQSSLTLSKVLLDAHLSVFVFKEQVDFQSYDFTLSDDQQRYYNMDLTYYENDSAMGDTMTSIRFEPVLEDAQSLSLIVYNPFDGEKTEFLLELDKVSYAPAKYLSKPVAVETGNPYTLLSIESASFASSGNSITYKMAWEGEQYKIRSGHPVSVGNPRDNTAIRLYEGTRSVAPTRQKPLEYLFSDNIVLGRMDFNNIRSLDSTVTIEFPNLYYECVLNQEVQVAPLFFNNEENQIFVPVGQYTIVLERMADDGQNYVIVYHVVDKTGEKLEGVLDAQLLVRANSGMEIILDAFLNVDKRGGDMVFDYSKVTHFIGNVGAHSLFLDLKSIYIALDALDAEVDLLSLPQSKQDTAFYDVSDSIVTAFEKRLEVKSGMANMSALTQYFSNEIISDDQIMFEYRPVATSLDTASFSAQVVAIGTGETTNSYYAVVQEMWLNSTGTEETHFARTHKVVIQKQGDAYIITDDYILR